MSNSYDVTTPLGQQWVDTPAQVHHVIDAYMVQAGADLANVTVVSVPDRRIGAGFPLPPGNFWP
jgi:hypothetical protein